VNESGRLNGFKTYSGELEAGGFFVFAASVSTADFEGGVGGAAQFPGLGHLSVIRGVQYPIIQYVGASRDKPESLGLKFCSATLLVSKEALD